MEQKTIYEQLGGEPAIDVAVDKFYDRVLADPIVSGYFAKTNMKFQRRHQKNFLTFATGGPNNYEGRNMREVHKDMHLEDIHMDQIEKHLGDTLLELGVKQELVKTVLDLVDSLRPEILNR